MDDKDHRQQRTTLHTVQKDKGVKVMNRFMAMACAAMSLLVGASTVHAQDYPSRPITYVIQFPAGNSSDVRARMIVDNIKKRTGKTIVVENKPGAIGIVGTKYALGKPADGYTIMHTSSGSHSAIEAFSKEVGFHPVNSFVPITVYARAFTALIVPKDSPYRTIGDLVKAIRENPDKMAYSYAAGSAWVIGVKFHKMLNLKALVVPYKASQDALMDMIGNRIQYMVTDGASAAAAVKGGQARALLLLGDDKSSLLPDTPTMKEAGFQPMPLASWAGVAGATGFPDPARRWLKKAFDDALSDPELREKMAQMGVSLVPFDLDPVSFSIDQYKLWMSAAAEAGITPN